MAISLIAPVVWLSSCQQFVSITDATQAKSGPVPISCSGWATTLAADVTTKAAMAVATRDIRKVRICSPSCAGRVRQWLSAVQAAMITGRASSPPARDHCPPRDKATGRSRAVGGAVSRHRLSVGVGAAHAGARHRRVYRCVDLARGAVSACRNCRDHARTRPQTTSGSMVSEWLAVWVIMLAAPSGRARGLVVSWAGRSPRPSAGSRGGGTGLLGHLDRVWVLGQHAGPSSRVTSRPTS